jgi:hypothetical protein
MSPQDLDRIRFITRHFHSLKGLETTVPLGVAGLIVGVRFFFPDDSLFSLVLEAACFLVCFLLWRRAPSYYRKILGEVEQPPKAPFPKNWSVYFLVLLILALVFVQGGWRNALARAVLACFSAFFLCCWEPCPLSPGCPRRDGWSLLLSFMAPR